MPRFVVTSATIDVAQFLVIGVALHNDYRALLAPAARSVRKPAESEITTIKAH
jgi:hypothetical protein